MQSSASFTTPIAMCEDDDNLWTTETMNNAAYPLELLFRVITVSLETN